MDVVERLTLEAANADSVIALEHRHRYEFAAALCADQRVLDLCCGSGYGSAILASRARAVIGVDNDLATIQLAQATVGRHVPRISFECADAIDALRGRLAHRFDAIVCFEGLEHLHGVEEVFALLRRHAAEGLRIIASVPNGKLLVEDNPYHLSEYGLGEVEAALAAFPKGAILPQFLAEGSLISPSEAEGAEVAVLLGDRYELEYANHFLFFVNVPDTELCGVHHGSMQLNSSPISNRWAEGLKRANIALRRENARLTRARFARSGSAAAAALVATDNPEAELSALRAEVADLRERCRVAETGVARWQGLTPDGGECEGPRRSAATAPPTFGEPWNMDDPDHPNSWQARRARAGDYLIPWIEQTVPLAGATVLEYGCGSGAVTSALSERCKHVIGVDIDEAAVAEASTRLRQMGVANATLEPHGLDEIDAAVRSRAGEVDVFVLYAVLEHMTVSERLAVLRLAREVIRVDGAIVVCEVPNRLIYFDHHTSWMPFFHLLPDELAMHYYVRSPRPDFKEAVASAWQAGPEAALKKIIRWGRGVSFHEFELVFDDLARHVVASNYDPLLFPERPVHPEELLLARYLSLHRPDLAPVWSRYWLDLILSPTQIARRPPFLRPWTGDLSVSHDMMVTSDETLRFVGRDARLDITLPHPTTRLVVGVSPRNWQVVLTINAAGSELQTAEIVAACDEQSFVSLPLAAPTQRVTIMTSAAADLCFIGYEE